MKAFTFENCISRCGVSVYLFTWLRTNQENINERKTTNFHHKVNRNFMFWSQSPRQGSSRPQWNIHYESQEILLPGFLCERLITSDLRYKAARLGLKMISFSVFFCLMFTLDFGLSRFFPRALKCQRVRQAWVVLVLCVVWLYSPLFSVSWCRGHWHPSVEGRGHVTATFWQGHVTSTEPNRPNVVLIFLSSVSTWKFNPV